MRRCAGLAALTALSYFPLAWSQADSLPQLYRDFYEYTLREQPEQATAAGRLGYNDRWSDPSPAAQARRLTELEKFRQRLRRFPEPPSGQERLNYRVFDWDVSNQIERIQTLGPYNTVNHFFGDHLRIFSTMAIAPAKTVQDYENQIARIRALPQWADSSMAAGRLAIERKKLQPKLVAERVIGQLETEAAPPALQSPLLAAFTHFPDAIPRDEQARLRDRAVAAYNESFRPAWHKLRDFVSGTYLPAARESIGLSQAFNGPEMYAYDVRFSTTTRQTPQQIHEIGLREVARLSSAMASIRQELGFTGTAQEFTEQVLNGPKFRFHSEEEIIAHGREIAKRIDPELPKLFKVLPRMTYGVQPIPPDRARTSAPYYQGPALDGSRAGYFFLRTVDPQKQSNCCMESLILHEAVPGHHLQIALAQEMEGVPDFRKSVGLSAFSEGWGLYAETLGRDLNMYRSPYERYGQLQTEIFRAGRLVVDTGIHSMGWSRQKALDYLWATGGMTSHDFTESEIDRYIAIPAQALSYKMGGLKIAELRAAAEKALGPKFDIREFHYAVLRNGALPLDILEEQIQEWIARGGG